MFLGVERSGSATPPAARRVHRFTKVDLAVVAGLIQSVVEHRRIDRCLVVNDIAGGGLLADENVAYTGQRKKCLPALCGKADGVLILDDERYESHFGSLSSVERCQLRHEMS